MVCLHTILEISYVLFKDKKTPYSCPPYYKTTTPKMLFPLCSKPRKNIQKTCFIEFVRESGEARSQEPGLTHVLQLMAISPEPR